MREHRRSTAITAEDSKQLKEFVCTLWVVLSVCEQGFSHRASIPVPERLDRDVEIVIKPKQHSAKRAAIRVVGW